MPPPRDLTRDLEGHSAALRRIARAVARDGASADDLVQDTWLAAIASTGAAGAPRSLGAWLGTVLRRLASAQRARERSVALDVEPEAPQSPFDAAACAEAAARLAAAIQRLPALDRDVVVRRFWHDEPPRRIAAALDLDVQAVRNRLHRALGRLREDLGRDRRTLLGLAGLGLPYPTTPVAALAAVLPMKLALSVALAAVVGWLLWVPLRTPRIAHDAVHRSALEQASALAAPATLEGVDGARVASAVEAGAASGGSARQAVSASPSEPAAEPALEVGYLWVEVADGLDGEPTQDFVLTIARDPAPDTDRPREIAGKDLTEVVPLPLGRYRGTLFGVGRDPVDLGPFTVFPSRVTNLGRWVFAPGSGSLEVAVVAPAGEAYRIELHGAGRRAGACCAATMPERCATCGHRADRSELALVAPSPVRFERLAAGPYTVIARAADERIVATQAVILAPAEARFLELAPGTRDVEVWLTDASGLPFDGVWREEDGEEYCAPIQLFGWAQDVLVAKGLVAPPEGGRALTAESSTGPTVAPSVAPPATEPAEDAATRPYFAAWPSAFGERPVVGRSEARAERLGPGRVALRGVPLELDGAQAQCGPFVTTLGPIDPARGDVIALKVTERCGAPSRAVLAAGTKSCTDCHRVEEARR